MQGFLEALDQRVLVCDGAIGTMLYARGVFLNRSFDELNLTQPDLVAEVHRDYLRAGADVIETNTFGANRVKLTNFGLADRLADINYAGAQLARHVAGDRAWVAGSIGPLGVRIEPWGRTTVADAEAAFREQAEALLSGGVDLFILETFGDLAELGAAIRGVRAASGLPIVAQVTTGEDGSALDGTPVERLAAALDRSGADVIGLNCSVGPAAMLETIEQMARVTSRRLAAQPNAGRPRDIDGRNLYLSSPEYMASYAKRFAAAGVRLVGGCCGTTPDHTREIARAVRSAEPGTRRAPVVMVERAAEPTPAVARRDKSALGAALAEGAFALLVEIAPPRGLDLAGTTERAQRYRHLGAVAVTVPDYPRSGARVSALALAGLLERHGVETLLHYTSRHRTLADVQSDLVAAHAFGISNLLATTGTPSRSERAPVHASSEVDAIGALHVIGRLNQGLDVAGEAIGGATAFLAGAVVNPFPADSDAEWRRLAAKIEAGAEFIMTPPVLDPEAFEPLLQRVRTFGVPVLAGVAAIESARHVELLASEVIGVRASEGFLHRLRHTIDEPAEGEAITSEIVTWLRPRVQGLVLTSRHGSPVTVERWVTKLGRHVRPEAVAPGVAHE